MQSASRRRTTWAIAASALAHLAVLILAVLQRPTLPPQLDVAAGPAQVIIPILIAPRNPHPATSGATAPSPVRPHLRSPMPRDTPSPVAPLAAERTPMGPLETSQPSAAAAPGPPAPDLRLALRHGVTGCANSAGMTRADRERCEDQLGRGAAQAPAMAIALEPRIRAYYNAVALAKALEKPGVAVDHRHMLTPGVAPPGTPGGDHVPLIGCRIPFGPGKPRKLPSHWLTLGPCFIAPPKGPFSVEADITPPDQDMNPR